MKTTTSKLFDLSTLKDMLDDDNAAVNMMLTKFLELSPKLLEDINISFENRNFEKVKRIAHEMKPSIDILNIEDLKSEIRLIEKHSADSTEFADLKRQMSKLNNIYNQVLKEIGEMIY